MFYVKQNCEILMCLILYYYSSIELGYHKLRINRSVSRIVIAQLVKKTCQQNFWVLIRW